MRRLLGQRAVVTGAASGIGAEIAIAFAREGADLVLADIVSNENAGPVIEAVRAHGRRALFVRTDVSDEAWVRAMSATAMEQFGLIDVLVNNTGVFTQSLLAEMSVQDWDRVMG